MLRTEGDGRFLTACHRPSTFSPSPPSIFASSSCLSRVALGVKNPPATAADTRAVGSIPGWGRSPGGGNGDRSGIPAGESHGQKSLAGYSPRGHERLSTHALSSAQSLSRVQFFVTSWTAAHQASLSITNCQSLLKLMSIESVMPSNRLILCHPLLLPSIFPSITVFTNESALHIRWPKYWSQCYHSIISSPNLLLPVTPSHRKSQLPPTSPGSSPRSASGPDTNPSVLGSQSM